MYNVICFLIFELTMDLCGLFYIAEYTLSLFHLE